jgi:predicted ester cyclase
VTAADFNKTLLRRFYEEVWGLGRLPLADELFAPDFTGHSPPLGDLRGVRGVKRWVEMWRKGMPDLKVSAEAQYAEENRVATRFRCTGTHTGSLIGFRPTGKVITLAGMSIAHVEGEKIARSWTEVDLLGLLQQLEVVPVGR